MINIWAVVAGTTYNLPMEALYGTANQLLGMNAGFTALQYKNVTFDNVAGQLAVPAGAVGAPSYSMTGQLGWGFYWDAANVGWALSVAGAQVDRATVTERVFSQPVRMNGALFEDEKGANIVAAATTDLGTATGNYLYITNAAGATIITSLGGATIPSGTEIETKIVITGGSVSFTHDPVALALLGGANLSMQNGDVCRWRKINDAAAYWEMVSFQRGTSSGSVLTNKGDLLVGTNNSGIIVPQRLPVGTDGQILVAASGQNSGLIWTDLNCAPNFLDNGLFLVNQRGAATNADDTYAHDRWSALTQSNPIAISTLTDVENGLPYMARLSQANAAAQRMGYSEIIEGKKCKHLRGRSITFRFGRVRLSTTANIRIAVLEWTGAEDVVTSDVVNDWTSAVYTAGNFFLAANLTVSSVVQQALQAATLTDGSQVTVTLGNTFNNLIVFVWTEAVVAQNVTLDVGKAKLEDCQIATPFDFRKFEEILFNCQRYFEKSYEPGTALATNTSLGVEQCLISGYSANQIDTGMAVSFKVPKRATAPTMSWWKLDGTPNVWSYYDGGAAAVTGTFTPTTSTTPSQREFKVTASGNTSAANVTAGKMYFAIGHWSASSDL